MRHEQLHVAHQPIVGLDDRRVRGSETLVRWLHPRLGMLLPGRFLPLAHLVGVTPAIDLQVLRATCRRLAADPSLAGASTNVSRDSLLRRGFVTDVLRVLAEHEVEGHRVMLELSEDLTLADLDLVADELRRLRLAGVQIVLDDLGSGATTLHHVARPAPGLGQGRPLAGHRGRALARPAADRWSGSSTWPGPPGRGSPPRASRTRRRRCCWPASAASAARGGSSGGRWWSWRRIGSPTMATTNDLKNGIVLKIDGNLWTVVEFQHVKPGKGPAFVRTKLKSVMSGKVVDKTFNAGLKVETATVDKRDMQYLYADGEDYVFMDSDTYDQLHVPAATVGDVADFLLENQTTMVAVHEGTVLYVELPASVELLIAHTDPGLQGDRSTGGTKPATLETGREIQVPLFLESGTKVKVDTRTGDYLGRVS